MRLTLGQDRVIRERIRGCMGQHARIWLFGSRADDSGGDVDLYVEPEIAPDLMACLQCKSALAETLDLDVDMIVQQSGRALPIYRIARQRGVAL